MPAAPAHFSVDPIFQSLWLLLGFPLKRVTDNTEATEPRVFGYSSQSVDQIKTVINHNVLELNAWSSKWLNSIQKKQKSCFSPIR